MSQKSAKSAVDISIIITAHSESILIHKTLASVRRAIVNLGDIYKSEIILHADNPSTGTVDYIENHKNTSLQNVKILINKFGDLGASRNFSIAEAHGTYVATIDADDIMSSNWLRYALDTLSATSEPTVAHSEFTVEFEGADSLVVKHGEIDKATDTLLSVYANRWNSVIVAPRQLLISEPYTPNTAGYGYEDWHLNCRLIHNNVHNILIPQTAIFVRRKTSNSEWLRQIQSMAVLRANPLLSFQSIRSLPTKNTKATTNSLSIPLESTTQQTKRLVKKIIKRQPLVHKTAKHIKQRLHSFTSKNIISTFALPAWLKQEWTELHQIDKQIFPSEELLNHLPIYDTITEEHRVTGSLYKQLVDTLNYDTYDYVIFAPWLVKGGADKYTIDYANAIANMNTKKRVLVITTLPVQSVWTNKLNDSVDFLDFGNITDGVSNEIKYRLMSHIIENAHTTHLHVINSEFGYDFIRLHATYIQATKKGVILTSFSQSMDSEGRTFGYSHTHVPFVYDLATCITSDNQAVIDMWTREYGFDSKKMLVHHQPIELNSADSKSEKEKAPHKPLRVLWAARISPEKQPELLHSIGTLVEGIATIDIYGTVDKNSKHAIDNLPANLTYKGSFDGLGSIQLDSYDCLLYTSLFDGMPNTILEAASSKLPVIASAVGGIPEFIDDTTGVLIKDIRNPKVYSRAIQHLAKNPLQLEALAENAYKRLRNDFSPKAYRANIESFLNKIKY